MRKPILFLLALGCLASLRGGACTNIIVTRGASTDGSVMVSYSADSHTIYGQLYFSPAADWAPGSVRTVNEWDGGRYLCSIPQPEHTFQRVGNMNEHQVIIGETTFGGRPELEDSTGVMDYGSMIYIALERSQTAREAIGVMTSLATEYGYASGGESFSIADKNEAWILEMTGKGCKIKDGVNANKGVVWVARRIPDGYVSGHANQARITTFPLTDPHNCMFADDVITFAREMGYFTGADKDFSFADAYCPLDFGAMRACEARVWAIFNRLTPGMERYVDYALGHNPPNRMPLWIKPAEKVSPKKVMDLMRDHYEGTPMDMRYDIGAGGHHLPYRWRPMHFEVDGVGYLCERAVATQQTGFWFVAQAREWLPDAIGGVNWFCVDDAGTSCLTPIYCSVKRIPGCFAVGNGDMTTYSPTSAFWLFNRVTNFAYLRYDRISADILKVVDAFENGALAEIPAVDAAAETLYKNDPALAVNFMTDYSLGKAQSMFDKWVELDRYLLVKYKDGNIMKEDAAGFTDNGNKVGIPVMPEQPGYNEIWKRQVAASTGDRLKESPVKTPETATATTITVTEQSGALQKIAEDVTNAFMRRDYSVLKKHFTAQMQINISEKRMNDLVTQVLSKHGEYKGTNADVEATVKDHYRILVFPCTFEKDRMSMKLTFDRNNKVTDLYLR